MEEMQSKEYYIKNKQQLESMVDALMIKQREEVMKGIKHEIIATKNTDRAAYFLEEAGVDIVGATYLQEFLTFPFTALHYAFKKNDYTYCKEPDTFRAKFLNFAKRVGWFTVGVVGCVNFIFPLAGGISYITHKVLDYHHTKKSLKYMEMIRPIEHELEVAKIKISEFERLEEEKKSKAEQTVKKFESKKQLSGYKTNGDTNKQAGEEIDL